jgi:hypothetical protein
MRVRLTAQSTATVDDWVAQVAAGTDIIVRTAHCAAQRDESRENHRPRSKRSHGTSDSNLRTAGRGTDWHARAPTTATRTRDGRAHTFDRPRSPCRNDRRRSTSRVRRPCRTGNPRLLGNSLRTCRHRSSPFRCSTTRWCSRRSLDRRHPGSRNTRAYRIGSRNTRRRAADCHRRSLPKAGSNTPQSARTAKREGAQKIRVRGAWS